MSDHGAAGMEPSESGIRWICHCGRIGKGSPTYGAAMSAFRRHIKTAQGGDE